ncbi:MAG: hypothetical protein JSV91_05020, partial [Phycisphaerales bacterium]
MFGSRNPRNQCLMLMALAAALCSWPAGGRSAHASGERVVGVEGSPVVVKVWEDRGAGGETVPHYAISLDGNGFSDPRPTSYILKLRHGRFDPLADVPAPAIE